MVTGPIYLPTGIYTSDNISLVQLLILHSIIGKPCGYGQYTWKNGSAYVGEFQNGLKNGFGKYRKSKESRTNMYEGQYFRDKKQGFGLFKWASGNVYKGQYKADEREGIGEMCWTDGSVYIGQWERGIQHGYGKMVFPDGTVKEGLFDNNVYKGPMKQNETPSELQSPNFNIMSLAPQDIFFSEEIKSFFPAVRPRGETSYEPMRVSPQRFPTTAGGYTEDPDELIDNGTKYSMPPLPAQNKHKIRSFSKDYRQQRLVPIKNEKNHGPLRSSSNVRKTKQSFVQSSRTLGGQLSTKIIRKSPATNATTIYYNNSVSPLKLRQQDPNDKKIWVPSGRVHYNHSPSRHAKFFT